MSGGRVRSTHVPYVVRHGVGRVVWKRRSWNVQARAVPWSRVAAGGLVMSVAIYNVHE